MRALRTRDTRRQNGYERVFESKRRGSEWLRRVQVRTQDLGVSIDGRRVVDQQHRKKMLRLEHEEAHGRKEPQQPTVPAASKDVADPYAPLRGHGDVRTPVVSRRGDSEAELHE